MTTSNIQIVNQPFVYSSGSSVSYLSITTLTVGAEQVRDSTNAYDIVISNALTLNAAVNGVNGLDTGTFTASTWYYVYAIGCSTNYAAGACLLSASATAPTLPAPYDVFRMRLAIRANSSIHFPIFWTSGTAGNTVVTYDAPVAVLTVSSSAPISFTTESLTSGLPPLANTVAQFQVLYTAASAGNAVTFRPTGSSSTTGPDVTSPAAAAMSVPVSMLTQVNSGNSSIDVKFASASDTLTLSVISYNITP